MGQGAVIDWPQWVRLGAGNQCARGAEESRESPWRRPPGGGPSARASGPVGTANKFLFFSKSENPLGQYPTAPRIPQTPLAVVASQPLWTP